MEIQELRKIMGLTQKEFANYYGLNVRTLQDWERGRSKTPSYLVNLLLRLNNTEKRRKEFTMSTVKEYTAQELQQMSAEELDRIVSEMEGENLPNIEVLKMMDVGVYDKNGRLIGEKSGGEY